MSSLVRGARPAAPVGVLDVDLAVPFPDSWPLDGEPHRYARAQVLVRRASSTVGVVEVTTTDGAVTSAALIAALERQLGLRLPGDRTVPPAGVAPDLRAAPLATVVLCTRGRPEYLSTCLRSLLRLRYPSYELVVVDNGSPADDVAGLVREVTGDAAGADVGALPTVTLVAESTPGLSVARNTGLRVAAGSFVAFTDDDAVTDPAWLAELWRAVATTPGAAGATGLVLPAELETRAQQLFEQFGGHSKGRAFTRQVIDPIEPGSQHPLYPLPAFGAGVNMGFRAEALREVGGFDPALGAGSLAGGSEDTALFSQVLLNGHSLVYTPDAVVRHYHRPDLAALERQLAGYGRGLTAYYTKMVVDRPRLAVELARLAPTALRDLMARDSTRNAGLPDDFPGELTRAQVRGMLEGPWAYLRGRRAARRSAAAARGAA